MRSARCHARGAGTGADHPPEVIVVVNGQDAEAVLICHGMGLDWLLTVPDLGYAFGPARMGMRLAIGRSMKIGPP